MTLDAQEAFVLLKTLLAEGTNMAYRNIEGLPGLALGVDATGRRHVLARLPKGLIVEPMRGANVELGEWWDPAGGRHLDLVCTTPTLATTFAAMADDIARRVRDGGQDPALAVRATWIEWRLLLQQAGTLSSEVRRGLFGELEVLRVLAEINAFYALDAWRGPSGDLHDFVTASGDIEVKTSKTIGLDVEISDLAQLDTRAGTPLLLMRIAVEDDPDGLGIGDAVDRAVCAGLVADEVWARVAEAGFVRDQEADNDRYSVRASMAWEVGPGFPGLRTVDVPLARRTGLRKLKYTLDLSTAGEPLGEHEIKQILRRMMTC